MCFLLLLDRALVPLSDVNRVTCEVKVIDRCSGLLQYQPAKNSQESVLSTASIFNKGKGVFVVFMT